MSRIRKPALAIAIAAAASLTGLAAGTAQAKSVSLLPTSCTQGTAAHMVYLSAGSKVTLGFGSSSSASYGSWHIVITDNDAVALNYTTVASTSWSVSTNRTLTKGVHVLALNAESLTTGEVCTLTVTNKV